VRIFHTALACAFLSICVLAANNPSHTSKPAASPKNHSPKKVKIPSVSHSEKTKPITIDSEERNRPPLMKKRLERFANKQAGLRYDEASEGPASKAEADFAQRAYPDTDIPLARFDAARSAAASLKGRPFPKGKGRKGTWVTVGPNNALFQLTPLRTSNSYVPNEYAAGGRTTTLAISNVCVPGHCRMWIGAAGGGIWRTDNALAGQVHWSYLSTPFGINSSGSIAVDPNDSTGDTVYVGTGEPNACGSGCVAGVGIYKSTDGGDTWTGPIGSSVFNGRGVGSIMVRPGNSSVIYAATARALLGASSVCCSGAVTLIPGAAPWGLYKSTDGGTSWSLIHNGAATVAGCDNVTNVANGLTACSVRGVRRIALDPINPDVVYAGSFGRGVWRSPDAGATWTQINPSLNSADASMRPEIAVTALPTGETRMYIAEGSSGSPTARLFRSDNVRTGAPVFTNLTSNSTANPGYGSFNYCTGQCWYDNQVVVPPRQPDMVYLLGSYQYGETGGISNGRGVVLSTDAGVSFTDMTMDATDQVHPNGIHPDQHFLVVNPNNPFQFFEASDGGVIRSSGSFADISGWCASRPISGANLARCQQLLSRVPTELQSLNKGLSTLQFQSLSISPFNSNIIQGGTQDNGTWESDGNQNKWVETMWGDGGQSGFDIGNPAFRFHTYAGSQVDNNFSSGLTSDWNWIGDPFFITGEAGSAQFYFPIISDPAVSQTMYAGILHVFRTKTNGIGTYTVDEYRSHCNEFFGDANVPSCGDWAMLGDQGANGRLTGAFYGATRAGGALAAVERTTGDTGTLWAATTVGRVFISKNADADPNTAVTFTRLDTLDAAAPNRFISGIYVDPANSNRAWVSYSGFSATPTSTAPGHVFRVDYNPTLNTATWTRLDPGTTLGDIPVTDIVRDDATGDLYISTDYGVFMLAVGATTWTSAAPGMPHVEVAGLTIVPGARKLYAATHGLGAWLLNLD
jgi:hypothetical protein